MGDDSKFVWHSAVQTCQGQDEGRLQESLPERENAAFHLFSVHRDIAIFSDCKLLILVRVFAAFYRNFSTVSQYRPANLGHQDAFGVKRKCSFAGISNAIGRLNTEKAFSDLGILGRYVFNPEIFETIKKTPPDHRGEIQITDAIRLLLETQPVYGYLFEGTRYDAGDKLGFIKATVSLALKRFEFSQPLKEYIKSLKT